MNILILGGSGIISSEITNYAIEQGNRVTIINRGRRKQLINPKALLVIADLKSDRIDKIRKDLDKHYDAVIDVISYDKRQLIRNIELTKGLSVQYCFFSTAVVYKTKKGKYRETDSIGNSDWSYAIDKIECENVLREKASEYNFHCTVIRPYVTYGKMRIPLQFGPLEYYTIVHRAKSQKVIPVYEKEVKCTLTYSKDFAVGMVSLLGNSRAYDECFNIVGNYETTWNDVLKTTFNGFGLDYESIGIDKNVFRDRTLMAGLNGAEILGDKSRDMLFDNQKLKSSVPGFCGETKYTEVISEIVEYYSDPNNQVVNYAWDARVDHVLSKLDCLTKEQKKRLKYSPGINAKFTDYIVYFLNRYTIPFVLYRIIKKMIGICKICLKRIRNV